MKQAWNSVKSFVTVVMTIAMVALLFIPWKVNKEVLMIFSASYGSVITYFFNKKDDTKNSTNIIEENTEKESK